jgi:SAM-dependent methyltransferase
MRRASRHSIKPDISWATPLYEYLRQCNATSLKRQILDCGAGGKEPPLALFYRYGYQTYGIEIAEEPLSQATQFCRQRSMRLNIFRGDMRHIPFTNESFSFVYAFNSIMFMTKPDIALSMGEIERVLKPGGLVYVNFVSVDEPDQGPFCETAPARELLKSERFAQHKDHEPDAFFADFTVVLKQKRYEDKLHGSKRSLQVYIEYIAEKK